MERREYTATGRTVQEALDKAKAALGLDTTDGFQFKVMERGKAGGFLGLGAKPAKVWLYEDIAEAEEEKQETKPVTEAEQPNRKKTEAPAENTGAKPTEAKEKPAQKQPAQKQNVKNSDAKVQKDKAPVASDEKDEAEVPASNAPAVKVADMEETDAALMFVRQTLSDLGIEADISGYLDSEGIKRIIIKGEAATSLIGHHGDTLDALQYLTNLAANREYKSGEKNRNRVTVDIEDYRAKREETLRALARRMANKALKYGRSVMLEPMNPYERRIIHSEVQNIPGVSTNSIGSENNRKVVIYLTDGGNAPKNPRK